MTEFAFSLEWEKLGNEGSDTNLVTERARVFGGWLVRVGTNPAAMALTFVADGEGRWDGEDFGVEDYENHHEPSDDAATIQREFFAGAVRTIIVALERFAEGVK